MIRILLVDDQKTIRKVLKSQLESEPDLKIVGIASDGHTAIEQVDISNPDIVLIDMEMSGLDGVSATSVICKHFPEVKVIVLSMHDNNEYVARSLQAGATGYLLKNTPPQDLKEAIRSVYRGYAQLAPGLFRKVISGIPNGESTTISKPSVRQPLTNKSTKITLGSHSDSPAEELATLVTAQEKKNNWLRYLAIWLLGNVLIWSASLLYLRFKPPVYTSAWTIALPGASSSTSINIPEIGQASYRSESPYNSQISDLRENYKLLALSRAVIRPAAERLQLTSSEFGKPRVRIVDNTTLIEFEMDGSTPQEAQNKALALHSALKNRLDLLRQAETAQQDQSLVDTLNAAEEKLQTARQQLAAYQISSGLNSSAQLQNSSLSIEELQREKARIASQQQQTGAQLEQLLRELGLSVEEAVAALSLQSDQLFQQYLANYNQISTELINLEAKYLPSHPAVIANQEEQQRAEAALQQRAESILGQPLTLATLRQLTPRGGSINESKKAALFQELITLQGEQRGLEEQAQALDQQIAQLESELKNQTQSGSELDKLRKNLQIAEAVYSSTLTKMELSNSNVSSTYPAISLMTQPSLPETPSSPKQKLILLGSTIGSLFLTTAMFTLWWRDRHNQLALALEDDFDPENHHQSLSASSNGLKTMMRK